MRILFLVTGIGYGDAIRVHAIIDELKKRYKNLKVMIGAYEKSYEYFKNKFPTIKIKGYKLPGRALKFRATSFIIRNYLLPMRWLLTALKLKRKVKNFNPDIIISDFEPSGIILSRMIKKKCIVIFGYDPEVFEEYKKKEIPTMKMYIQARFFEKLYKMANYVIIPKLLGVKKESLLYFYVNPVVKKRKISSERELMKKLKLKKKPIVVMLGGSEFAFKVAKEINKISDKFDEEFVIFGGREKLECKKNVRHFLFRENFLEYLKVSKAMITLAGQCALVEGLYFKKPMLIFPIEDHIEQILNAYVLKDYALIGKRIDLRNMEIILREFLRRNKELEAKVKMLKVDFNGAMQVAEFLKSVISE